MNIKELIESTNKVSGREQSFVFQKKFGTIYSFNKNITIPKGGNAIIVSMMIGGVSDMILSGGKRKPVAYHKVSLALRVGKDGKKEYSPSELAALIRIKHPEYGDKEEWPNWMLLKKALEDSSIFFNDSTVFERADGDGYVLVTNNIPEESEVQVWCSCSDYYWTFQYYNMQTRNEDNTCLNLYGASGYPKTYNHQSSAGKKSKSPLRNPGRNPGMCKHLMLLTAMLMEDEIITDTKNGLKKYYKANYSKFIKGNERERVSKSVFKSIQEEYKKDHKELSRHRRNFNFRTGNKIESKFNPFTGNRTYKTQNGFNANDGTFAWEKKRRKGK